MEEAYQRPGKSQANVESEEAEQQCVDMESKYRDVNFKSGSAGERLWARHSGGNVCARGRKARRHLKFVFSWYSRENSVDQLWKRAGKKKGGRGGEEPTKITRKGPKEFRRRLAVSE